MKNSILFMLGISLFSMTACSDGDKEVKQQYPLLLLSLSPKNHLVIRRKTNQIQ